MSLAIAQRALEKKEKSPRQLKVGIDHESARRKRVELTVQLRKDKRDQLVSSKRRMDAKHVVLRDDKTSEQKTSPPLQNDLKDSKWVTTMPNPALLSAARANLVVAQALASKGVPQLREVYTALATVIPKFNSDQPVQQYEGVFAVRKLLCVTENPPIQPVIDCQFVPRLVHFLMTATDPKIQLEAAWALTNVVSGTSAHTRTVVEYGALPCFLSLLKTTSPESLSKTANPELFEQAIYALGNIAGDGPLLRDVVIRSGALPLIVAACKPHAPITMLSQMAWAFANMCRFPDNNPAPSFASLLCILPALGNLLTIKNRQILEDTCFALSQLSFTKIDEHLHALVMIPNLVTRLVPLLMHKDIKVKKWALRTVGNLLTSENPFDTQSIIDAGAIASLVSLTANPKKEIQKDACFALSNIMAGTADQIQQAIDKDVIAILKPLSSTGQDFEVQSEALWALCKGILGGTHVQRCHFVAQDVIPCLCNALKVTDSKLLLTALDSVDVVLMLDNKSSNSGASKSCRDMFEEHGGLDTLDSLQNNENEKIYLAAVEILKRFFEAEDDVADGIDLKPSISVDGNTFNFAVDENAPVLTLAKSNGSKSNGMATETSSNFGAFSPSSFTSFNPVALQTSPNFGAFSVPSVPSVPFVPSSLTSFHPAAFSVPSNAFSSSFSTATAQSPGLSAAGLDSSSMSSAFSAFSPPPPTFKTMYHQ